MNGKMERWRFHCRGQKLKWKEIEERPVLGRLEKEGSAKEAPRAPRRKWRPGPDHPWRSGYRERDLQTLLSKPAGAHGESPFSSSGRVPARVGVRPMSAS